MLRIAVPNKGSLSESAVDMLREAGYAIRRDTKELVVADPDNDAEFFYLRPRDIAIYVGSGTVDAGAMPDGRPVGVQVVGRPFDDVGVLRALAWLEQG